LVGLPEFTADGVLPVGDFELTLDEIRESVLVKGPGADHPHWDIEWRRQLVHNLEILVGELWEVGVTEIFIDGSFLEDKDHPNDIDGYFECDWREFVSGALQDRLNQLDPHRIWTWDPAERRLYRGYPKKQLPMWHQYRVELYPHLPGLVAGGDRHGNPLEFPAFFRTSRRPLLSGVTQKGIVKIRRPS
jgi:hypothetical protein